jgi:hypothetical protein
MLTAAAVAAGLAVALPATAANAATETFTGSGPLPSDAHAQAVAAMHEFSPTCVEVSTTYSEAGSEHFWTATLTADC